jgi:hypothetical protein
MKKKKINSKQKGAAGERECAKAWSKAMNTTARRGQQFSGSPDSPDIVHDIPGIHIECKRTERFKLYDALDQAEEDKHPDDVPVVLHRRNLKQWVAIINLEDLPEFIKKVNDYVSACTPPPIVQVPPDYFFFPGQFDFQEEV